jgi:hypothetical protein
LLMPVDPSHHVPNLRCVIDFLDQIFPFARQIRASFPCARFCSSSPINIRDRSSRLPVEGIPCDFIFHGCIRLLFAIAPIQSRLCETGDFRGDGDAERTTSYSPVNSLVVLLFPLWRSYQRIRRV